LAWQYAILGPWAIHGTYSFWAKEKGEREVFRFLILPFLVWRMVHSQIWISVCRYRTAKGAGRIVDRGLEFDQVDRETNWLVVTHLFVIWNLDIYVMRDEYIYIYIYMQRVQG